jgi:hypothetical protein
MVGRLVLGLAPLLSLSCQSTGASPTERYFPLTAAEKALLLSLYPADWRAR